MAPSPYLLATQWEPGRRSKQGKPCSCAGRSLLMLRLPPFRYLAPRHLDEAAQMLEEEGDQAMLVAADTDLYPHMKRRQFSPPVLHGFRDLPEFKTINRSPVPGMLIGAGVNLT